MEWLQTNWIYKPFSIDGGSLDAIETVNCFSTPLARRRPPTFSTVFCMVGSPQEKTQKWQHLGRGMTLPSTRPICLID
jgi:hypothetical protein